MNLWIIINNIQLTQELAYMLRTTKICNPIMRFQYVIEWCIIAKSYTKHNLFLTFYRLYID